MPKTKPREVVSLEDIPYVGEATAKDLRRIGIKRPEQLKGRDPLRMFEQLRRATGTRQDPCVLDVFISAVRFMEGGPPLPWWHYTPERKRLFSERIAESSGDKR